MISKVICKNGNIRYENVENYQEIFKISSMKYYRTHAVGQQLFYLTQTFVNGIVNI